MSMLKSTKRSERDREFSRGRATVSALLRSSTQMADTGQKNFLQDPVQSALTRQNATDDRCGDGTFDRR